MKTLLVLMLGAMFLSSCENAPQQEAETSTTEVVAQDSNVVTGETTQDTVSSQPVGE